MRTLATIGILTLLASAGTARDPKPDAARERQSAIMKQVKSLVLQHKPAEAIALAEQVIADGDARVAAEKRHVYSGQTAEMVLANMFGALNTGDAVDIGPSYGEALFWKGFALIDSGRADEAGPFLDHAVAVSPNNSQFLCEDGTWHGQHHDTDRAMALFDACAASTGLFREEARSHFSAAAKRGQGYILIDLGRLDEAQKRFEESLTIEPDSALARNELRYIQQQRDKAKRGTT